MNHQQSYREPVQEHPLQRRASSVRNERMTALAGIMLFVLIVVELVVTANLHALISVHIFVGVLLCGPLVAKLCSVGYRFFRYYTNSPVFVRKGPPNIILRLLAPFLVLMTLLVFMSGITLALVGPTHMGLIFKIHAASVALWIPLVAVHIYAYFRKAFGMVKSDWNSSSKARVSGRSGRLTVNIGAVIVGAIAAIIMLPISSSWNHWRIDHGLPSPLILGVLAGVFAILIAIPILRKFNYR